MPENLENSAVAAGLEKVSFSFEIQRRTMQKNIQLPLFHTLTPWKTIYEQSNRILKHGDVNVPTNLHLVNTMIFPVGMYGCNS